MPKLRLTLEDLAVESFDPTPSRTRRSGTVRAHQETDSYPYPDTAWGACYTAEYYCGESLNGTCNEETCAGDTCNGGWNCIRTYGATCPDPCRTWGVYC